MVFEQPERTQLSLASSPKLLHIQRIRTGTYCAQAGLLPRTTTKPKNKLASGSPCNDNPFPLLLKKKKSKAYILDLTLHSLPTFSLAALLYFNKSKWKPWCLWINEHLSSSLTTAHLRFSVHIPLLAGHACLSYHKCHPGVHRAAFSVGEIPCTDIRAQCT